MNQKTVKEHLIFCKIKHSSYSRSVSDTDSSAMVFFESTLDTTFYATRDEERIIPAKIRISVGKPEHMPQTIEYIGLYSSSGAISSGSVIGKMSFDKGTYEDGNPGGSADLWIYVDQDVFSEISSLRLSIERITCRLVSADVESGKEALFKAELLKIRWNKRPLFVTGFSYETFKSAPLPES